MEIYIQTDKATANIFGHHTQPRKTTRYTNKLKLAWVGGKEKEPNLIIVVFNVNSLFSETVHLVDGWYERIKKHGAVYTFIFVVICSKKQKKIVRPDHFCVFFF